MTEQCSHHRRNFRRVRRVIHQSGEKNIRFKQLPEKIKRFFSDFVTTIIHAQWRFVISVYLILLFGSWTLFALIWYLISYSHNDLTIDGETGQSLHEGAMKCVEGASSFTEFFLLSFELQSTIGFGERYPNEECPEGVFTMVAQIVVGNALQGIIIGIIYVKLIRPPRNQSVQIFSRKAVISQRDGDLCLLFRICDPNEMHIADSKVQACLIGDFDTTDDEKQNPIQHQLNLEDEGRVHVIFPITVCHVIDCDSPLYTFSAEDFLEKRFEIIVTFTGTSLATGYTTEERTSYLSNEIIWGYRFVNMIDYDDIHDEYLIDYDRLDLLEEIDTLLCSAQMRKTLEPLLDANVI